MKNVKMILKGAVMSAVTLAVGFLAIALPFRLFKAFNSEGLHVMFAIELAVYFITAMIYLAVKEKKRAEKARQEARRFQRRAKFEQAQREYYDLAA